MTSSPSYRAVRFCEKPSFIPYSPPELNQRQCMSLQDLPLSSRHTDHDLHMFQLLMDTEEFIPLDIYTAASLDDEQTVRQSMQRGIDQNDHNSFGWTPLMYGAYIGHKSVCHFLLNSGVKTESKNMKGQTALMLAATCGNEHIAKLLIEHNANLETKDNRGWTALFYAVNSNQIGVVRTLLDANANHNLCDAHTGLTLTQMALSEGLQVMAETLMKFDDSTKRRNSHNKSKQIETKRPLSARNKSAKVAPNIMDGPHRAQQLFPDSKLLETHENPQTVIKEKIQIESCTDCEPQQPCDIKELFSLLKLDKYYSIFESKKVDLDDFLKMDDTHLKSIGIKLLGPRKKMTNVITRWNEEGILLPPTWNG